MHGGQLPSMKKHAKTVLEAREKAEAAARATEQGILLGDAVRVEPTEEMMRQIFISAGAAEYYRNKVSGLSESEQVVTEYNEKGDALRLRKAMYIELWDEERSRLFDFCKKAREAGVEEAQVHLAQGQAALMAKVLDLSAVQLKATLMQQFGLGASDGLALESKIREVLGTQLMLVAESEYATPQEAITAPASATGRNNGV